MSSHVWTIISGVMGKKEGEKGKKEEKILGTNFLENTFGLNAKVKAFGGNE